MTTSYFKARYKSRIDLRSISVKGYGPAALALSAFAVLLLSTNGCAPHGYAAAAKSAQSELSTVTQARDTRLKLHLREALLLNELSAGLSITPYVFMERGFVIGFVESKEQADEIERVARGVEGLRSLYAYLPVRKADTGEKGESDEITSAIATKLEIRGNLVRVPDIVTSQISLEVLDAEVVLLGVVASERVKEEAEREAYKVSGVKHVKNLLLLPETEYMKRIPLPHLLR